MSFIRLLHKLEKCPNLNSPNVSLIVEWNGMRVKPLHSDPSLM